MKLISQIIWAAHLINSSSVKYTRTGIGSLCSMLLGADSAKRVNHNLSILPVNMLNRYRIRQEEDSIWDLLIGM